MEVPRRGGKTRRKQILTNAAFVCRKTIRATVIMVSLVLGHRMGMSVGVAVMLHWRCLAGTVGKGDCHNSIDNRFSVIVKCLHYQLRQKGQEQYPSPKHAFVTKRTLLCHELTANIEFVFHFLPLLSGEILLLGPILWYRMKDWENVSYRKDRSMGSLEQALL